MTRLAYSSVPAIALLACAPSLMTGQTPGLMVTDRPDQTESTAIVHPGLVQAELGGVFSFARDEGTDTETLTLGAALFRVGVLRMLEARVGFAGWVRSELTDMATASTETGVGSLELGLKYRVTEGGRYVPAIAILSSVSLPLGTEGIRSERVDPTVRIAFSHELSDRMGIGYNVGVRLFSVEQATEVSTESEGIYSLSLGVALTSRLGMFLEGFGAFGTSDGAASGHLIDGGLTLAVRENVQVDLSGGAGYAGDTEDWFVGAGVSFRLPR